MMRTTLLILAISMVGTLRVHAQDDHPLQVMGGSYPDPWTSEGHVILKNNSDRSVICSIKMKGIISGTFMGLAVKATHESEPAENFLLEPGQYRQQVFKFLSKVLLMRATWHDEHAILTEIDDDSLIARCSYAEPPDGIQEQTYMLVNQHSGKCLNLEVAILNRTGFENGARVFQFDCPSFRDQRWTNSLWNMRRESARQYRIESKYSGKCLDLYTGDGGLNNGDRVQQYDCYVGRSSILNRNWLFTATDKPGVYFIQSAFSGKCLDLSVNNPATDGFRNRDKVQQWQCAVRDYQANQMWRLVPVP